MSGRAALLAALLAAGAAAGCLGGDGHDGGPEPTTRPTTMAPPSSGPPPGPVRLPLLLDFALHGCSGLSVVQSQPLSDIQPLLPEPFVAAPFPLAPGVAADRGAVVVDLLVCANLTTPNAAVERTFYGQAYTFVERPADLLPDAPETPAQEYVFRVLAGEDILATLWAAAGYETHNGSAFLSLAGMPAPARAAQGHIGLYAADAAAAADPADPITVETPFARYARRADGGLLYWTGSYSFPTVFSGTGDFTVPDDDAFAPFRGPLGNLGGFALAYEAGDLLDSDLVLITGL